MLKKTKIYEKIRYILWSNKFYRTFFKPFDRLYFPFVDHEILKIERKTGSVPLNKIPHVADLENPEWKMVIDDMKDIFTLDEHSFHRKIWESVHVVYALMKSGYLAPENKGLAVGAGREQILYYLAHKVAHITGIDLYEGQYLGGEDERDIPEVPEKYRPFQYPGEKLKLLRMNALELDFQDDSFDFIFSLSSIEHFGRLSDIRRALLEMYRVLKPGGGCLITTEVKLNRLGGKVPNTRIFRMEDLMSLFKSCGFQLQEQDMDMRLEERFFNNWVKLPEETFKSPHIHLKFNRVFFTSLAVLLVKPGNMVKKGDWTGPQSFVPFNYRGEIEVSASPPEGKPGSELPVTVRVKNTSNFDWFCDGHSYRIAIWVKLLDENGDHLDDHYSEIIIPEFIKTGASLAFDAKVPLPKKEGRYILFFDLKKERLYGFSYFGNPTAELKIGVLKS